ncbi:MAG: hypothetical protein ACTJLM_03715 [Ehrlichia sp.]
MRECFGYVSSAVLAREVVFVSLPSGSNIKASEAIVLAFLSVSYSSVNTDGLLLRPVWCAVDRISVLTHLCEARWGVYVIEVMRLDAQRSYLLI